MIKQASWLLVFCLSVWIVVHVIYLITEVWKRSLFWKFIKISCSENITILYYFRSSFSIRQTLVNAMLFFDLGYFAIALVLSYYCGSKIETAAWIEPCDGNRFHYWNKQEKSLELQWSSFSSRGKICKFSIDVWTINNYNATFSSTILLILNTRYTV